MKKKKDLTEGEAGTELQWDSAFATLRELQITCIIWLLIQFI